MKLLIKKFSPLKTGMKGKCFSIKIKKLRPQICNTCHCAPENSLCKLLLSTHFQMGHVSFACWRDNIQS
jgi:hypothetical protein